jgi:hypothetical protein
MRSAIDKILLRMRSSKAGRAFVPKDFLDLGSRAAVDQALTRLVRSGKIRRVCRGVYDYPRRNPRLKLDLPPTPVEVARAVAQKTGSRLQVSGAFAANALGLSKQVPARQVFVTDGPSRIIPLGKHRVLELRHAPRRAMVGAGTTSGLVFQALTYLGRDYIDEGVINAIRNTLASKDKQALLQDARNVAPWLRPIIAQIGIS